MAVRDQGSPPMFEICDPLGYTVFMTEECWYGHITEDHPEMAREFDTIQNTVTDPDVIFPSAEYDDCSVYFKYRDAKYSKLKYCKVVVSLNEEAKTGKVATAFKRKNIGGNIIDDSPKYIKSEL